TGSPAWKSLKANISRQARNHFPVRLPKFPVPLLREFRQKCSDFLALRGTERAKSPTSVEKLPDNSLFSREFSPETGSLQTGSATSLRSQSERRLPRRSPQGEGGLSPPRATARQASLIPVRSGTFETRKGATGTRAGGATVCTGPGDFSASPGPAT